MPQAQVDAHGRLADAEPVREPVEEVQPVQRAGRPQHAGTQLVGAEGRFGREGVAGAQYGVHRFEADQAVGQARAQRRVDPAEGHVDVAREERVRHRRQVAPVAQYQRA
ncbi:hypothetical protein FB387_002685 [Streptomyces cinereoruber]|nr:hypothetical protein [Streptomyces cinereoruber]NIH61556.1 hypothetical protein [Streptomyces cinereoruber]